MGVWLGGGRGDTEGRRGARGEGGHVQGNEQARAKSFFNNKSKRSQLFSFILHPHQGDAVLRGKRLGRSLVGALQRLRQHHAADVLPETKLPVYLRLLVIPPRRSGGAGEGLPPPPTLRTLPSSSSV